MRALFWSPFRSEKKKTGLRTCFAVYIIVSSQHVLCGAYVLVYTERTELFSRSAYTNKMDIKNYFSYVMYAFDVEVQKKII